uniref:Uncharacterized protein n=1 Tax=Oryza meridionalis TaxID=40149 RepID=A0A0E0E4B6_9ORYZ
MPVLPGSSNGSIKAPGLGRGTQPAPKGVNPTATTRITTVSQRSRFEQQLPGYQVLGANTLMDKGVSLMCSPNILMLTCDVCRGETANEICLFPDHPCPHHLGQMAFVMCYPTCDTSGHMVRKCKDCGALGSVSLIPGKGKALTPDSKNMVIPAPYWIATKVNGDQHELRFSEDGFEGYGDNDELILTSAKFTVERLKKAEKMSVSRLKTGQIIDYHKGSGEGAVGREQEARKGARESGQSGRGQVGRRKAWSVTA